MNANGANGQELFPVEGDQESGNVEGDGPFAEAEEPAEKGAVRPLRAPQEPTEDERESHFASGHVPYRKWCRHCIAGRGRSDAHSGQVNRDEDAMPLVVIDYGFMGDDDNDESASPILAFKDKTGRWTSAELLPSKGTVHSWNTKVLVRECANTGSLKFYLRQDRRLFVQGLQGSGSFGKGSTSARAWVAAK